jgi:hypothetical protein
MVVFALAIFAAAGAGAAGNEAADDKDSGRDHNYADDDVFHGQRPS